MGGTVLKQFIREILHGISQPGIRGKGDTSNLMYDIPIKSGGSEDHVEDMGCGDCPTCGADIDNRDVNCKTCMSMMSEHAMAPTKQAACVLIVSADGKILAVSRKDNPEDFGMPGGKVDPGETPAEAAARELTEETGLTAIDLIPVFSQHDGDSECTTFVGKITGEINTDESGVIRWVDPSVLLKGKFKKYNFALLCKIGYI